MTKNADFGPNLAIFGPKSLIFMGVSKSFGTNITENHLDNLSALFFGQALDQMGQKCPYLAENEARRPFGPQASRVGWINVIFLLSFYLSLKMKRFAFLFWRTVCPMKSWRQWQRCTKWRIAQMLRWAHKHILRISVEHWALGMDVIHSNTNENMRISIKGNVTKRMPKKWICCQWSVCLYHKNPLECF